MRILIGGVALLALAGCDQTARTVDQPASSPPTVVPQVAVGKYIIIHSPQVERDTMLLDTVTGDTWQLVKLGKAKNSGMGWEFVGKLDQPPSPLPPTLHTTN
ncbi:MAG: hypothetical protein JO290_14400 [Sphingomonadaceae bacterium]|nr:hypothetical protein [Sphingomonadaceae bacterium]